MSIEIDMASPWYNTRSVSAKRPRTPDSPSERPAKRLSLAIDRVSNAYEGRNSANSSRQSSEDWVRQAGVLSIDSPHLPFTPASGTENDDDMAVDSEERETQRPFLSSLHTHSFGPTPPDSATYYQHESASLSVPAISVQPATPEYPFQRATTPIHESPAGMQVSSPTPFGSPMKRKFMMGPRQNCLKCRLGVKGHSVHLD